MYVPTVLLNSYHGPTNRLRTVKSTKQNLSLQLPDGKILTAMESWKKAVRKLHSQSIIMQKQPKDKQSL